MSGMTLTAEDKRESARCAFKSLQLSGWEEVNQSIRQGGEASVLIVKNQLGDKGVFRYLKRTDPVSLKRFHRELNILTNPRFQNPSIIQLLEHSKDDKPWYISKYGEPFDHYWEKQRNQLINQPDELAILAIRHLVQILEGLAPLHQAGVVHRDIKPQNLVIFPEPKTKNTQATLIDFGIAHFDEEPRLTPLIEAPGNRRYSPDQMMNRMESIPPWLDIFELAQVLIWMIGKTPIKHHWQRPLHWQWVIYDELLAEEYVLGIRALTALCSEESVSPKDALEMLNIVRTLFPTLFKDPNMSHSQINIDQINAGISRGKASQKTRTVEDRQVISSSFPVMQKIYEGLRGELELLYKELSDSGLPVKKEVDRPLNELIDQVMSSALSSTEATLFEIELGENRPQTFHLRVRCWILLPSHRPHYGQPLPPETANPIAFFIQRYSNPPHSRVNFPNRTNLLTLEEGKLTLRNEFHNVISQPDIRVVISLIKGWVEDGEAWETINKI